MIEEFALHEHSNSVNSIYFLSDGKYLVSGSYDRSIGVLKISKRNLLLMDTEFWSSQFAFHLILSMQFQVPKIPALKFGIL